MTAKLFLLLILSPGLCAAAVPRVPALAPPSLSAPALLAPAYPSAGLTPSVLSTPLLAPASPAQMSVAPVSVAPAQAPFPANLPARLERRFALLDGEFPLPAAGYTASVRFQIRNELMSTARAMPEADGDMLETVAEEADRALAAIERRLDAKEIDPRLTLNVDPNVAAVKSAARAIKVGVYPVAGDPLHWGHLILALRAIGELGVDKVVFVLAGDDPRKPAMTPAADRHPMGRKVLDLFAPFFAYSPIALGTQFDGETNIFRLLELNPSASVEAWYMVGDDHYHLKDKKGNPDTLPKLEANRRKAMGPNSALHQLKVAFIAREHPTEAVPTSLEVKFLESVGFEASSSLVRAGRRDLMPCTAFDYACRKGLYGLGR